MHPLFIYSRKQTFDVRNDVHWKKSKNGIRVFQTNSPLHRRLLSKSRNFLLKRNRTAESAGRFGCESFGDAFCGRRRFCVGLFVPVRPLPETQWHLGRRPLDGLPWRLGNWRNEIRGECRMESRGGTLIKFLALSERVDRLIAFAFCKILCRNTEVGWRVWEVKCEIEYDENFCAYVSLFEGILGCPLDFKSILWWRKKENCPLRIIHRRCMGM